MKLNYDDIVICEYEPKHAAGLAEMWNNSSSEWNGMVFNYSTEQVISEQANSSAVAQYVALYKDQVLGYVDILCEAKKQTHICMLNVLPDYHGCGIGKKLLHACVYKTLELKIPVLSLFTWPGNTKAIPLYKKCGFFWQEMQNPSTYLLNYLPGIISHELLAPYFDYFNWYKDQVRDLSIITDGEKENGFTYYSYLWQKDGKSLKVVVEKGSREIVEIHSPDFHISCKANRAKVVFGLKYSIKFHYESFSPDYNDFSLKSEDNELIDYKLKLNAKAEPSRTIDAEYTPLFFDGATSEWEVLPAIKTKLCVAGKSVVLGISQEIFQPLDIKLLSYGPVQTDTDQYMYLNVESMLEVPASFRLIFPDDDKVQIQTKVLEISLNAREKQTYTLRYQTSGSAVYNPEIEVKVKTQDSTEQQYFTHESTPILTNRGCDAKGTKSDAFIIAANSYVKMPLKNQNNWAYFYSDQKPTTTRYSPCDFGQPYSGEFEEQDPERICYSQSGDSASMEVFYESRKHIGLKFSKVFTLFPSGELDLVFKFQNIPDDAMDLNLRQRISFYIKECKFMQNSEVISMLTDCDQLTLDDFDPNSISEPWIFAKQSSDNTHCLTWHKGWNLSFEYNFLLLDVALADIKSTMDMKSPAIRVYHNLFQSAGAFRNFVMGKSFDSPAHYNSVDVISNNHNPIFPDVIALKPVHHHKLSLEHTLEIPSQNYSASATEDTIHSLPLDNAGLSILDAKLRFPYFDLDCKRLILNSVGTIDTHEGASEITINNGSLSFSAAKDNRFPLISSLKMDVIECLESAEPDFGPRAGRNPFVGGLFMMPSSMNEAKLLREKHVLQRADYYDQYQNLWQGLSWETAIEEIEFLKGARYRSLFLTMPGIPVLLNSVEIVSWPKRTGYESFYQYIFVNSKNVLPDAVFGFLDEHGNWQEYRKSEYACYPQGNYAVSRIRNEKISMNVMSDLYGHSAFTVKAQYLMARNMVYSRELCKAGDILDPIFIVFSNANLNDKMAQDLLRIKLTKA